MSDSKSSKRNRMAAWLPSAGESCFALLIAGLALGGCGLREQTPGSAEGRAATTGPARPGKAASKRPPEERNKATTPSPAPTPKQAPRYPMVTPIQTPSGRVISVNTELRFVVLDFSLNPAPAAEQRLGLYRENVKVGELRITRWSSGSNVVANIVAGEAKIGDEAREE